MVVDDAVVVRGLLTRWIEAEAGLQIVGSMRSGREAIEQLERANPDVVILDVDMPDTDGITALPRLLGKEARPRRDHGVDADAPQRRDQLARARARRRRLYPEAADHARDHDLDVVPPRADRQDQGAGMRAASTSRRPLLRLLRARTGERLDEAALRQVASPSLAPARSIGSLKLRPLPLMPPRVLLIGASTGGPQALNRVLGQLNGVIDHAPVLVVQHMPPTFTTILAEHLARAVGRPAHEAIDGEEVRAGQIYIAPGGRHMRVARRDGNPTIALDDGPLVNFCKPAVDPLVRLGGGDLGLARISPSCSPEWAPTAPAARRRWSRPAAP